MIKRRSILLIALSTFVITLAGCQDTGNEAADDPMSGTAADTTVAAEVDQLEQDLDRMLDAAGDDIAALENQVEEAGASAREDLIQQLERAKQQRDSLRARVDALEQTQDDQTRQARMELREARRALNERLDALTLRTARGQDAFVEAAEERLDRLDQQLAELKRSARDTGDQVDAEVENDIERLEQRRDELRADVQRAKQATSEEFAEVRRDLTDRIAATRADAAAALDQFKERVEPSPTASPDSTNA